MSIYSRLWFFQWSCMHVSSVKFSCSLVSISLPPHEPQHLKPPCPSPTPGVHPELDYKENWALKNWCFWTVVLEKTLDSPLNCKDIEPVHPKGNQSWVFTGRTNVEAEIPMLWPPDTKSWHPGKDPDAGKDWGQEEKETTEEERVGWHHRLNIHEFGGTPGVGNGQEAWHAAVHEVAKSWTTLSDWTERKQISKKKKNNQDGT